MGVGALPDHLILASGSQPRMRMLQAAGLAFVAAPSGVDEDEVDGLPPEKTALVLAERKAHAVAAGRDEGLVVGCDTILVMDGEACGKPVSLDQARQWCRAQRNTTVEVVTGHCVIDASSATRACRASWSSVMVGPISDAEIEAYLATGEALQAAGGLTIDGYGAPFISGIRGDHGTVIGISLPTLRDLLAELDVPISALWR